MANNFQKSVILIPLYFSGVSLALMTNFNDGYIGNQLHQSFHDCKVTCDWWDTCHSAKYYRRYKLCEYFDVQQNSTAESGTRVYSKQVGVHLAQSRLCSKCSRWEECRLELESDTASCHVTQCPIPESVIGANMYGNTVTVGSRIMFKCVQSDDFAIIQCLENGSWSFNGLVCACEVPDVEHAENIIFTPIGDDVTKAEVICERGYTLLKSVYPICNITTKTWSPSFDEICCDMLNDDTWNKIYRFPSDISIGILGWYKPPKNARDFVKANCRYRNVSVLTDWNGRVKIEQVRFSVIKDETEVAYVTFNGVGSDKWNWFAKENILASSWDDLSSSTDLDVISSSGQGLYGSVARFFIGKQVNGWHCEGDSGWIIVTHNAYPCPDPVDDGVKILYSKANVASEFTRDQIGFADRFEIWIMTI